MKPKLALVTGFRDSDTGESLTDDQTLAVLGQNIPDRGQQSDAGDPQWVRHRVRHMVTQCRATCLQQVGAEPAQLCISAVSLVQQLKLKRIHPRKASIRLPRAASKSSNVGGFAVTWTVLNLIFSWALVPSTWFRVVAPIRKRGPQIVSDPDNLRPISYVDDLESCFDLIWLSMRQEKLTAFSGGCQAGGIFDPILMSLGIGLAAQIRAHIGLPTVVLKADLLHSLATSSVV